jgi:hypothetical protein
MKRASAKVVILGSVVGILIACYAVFWEHLPPETALKRARSLSGLSVPGNAEVERFESTSSRFGADVYVRVELRLNAEAFESLAREARVGGYQPLPARPSPYPVVRPFVAPDAVGWHRISESARGRKIVVVVLDARRQMLLAQLVIS